MRNYKDHWFLKDYKQYAEEVARWNMIANNGQMNRSYEALKIQERLIEEEFNELVNEYGKEKIDFLKELCDLFVVSSYMMFLKDEVDDITFINDTKYGSPSISGALGTLSDLILMRDWYGVVKCCVGLLTTIDADTKKALSLVNQNNFSKFVHYDEESEVIYDHIIKEIESKSEGRYTDITWAKVGDYVVFKDGKGKIMKPTNYKSVNLEGCI